MEEEASAEEEEEDRERGEGDMAFLGEGDDLRGVSGGGGEGGGESIRWVSRLEPTAEAWRCGEMWTADKDNNKNNDATRVTAKLPWMGMGMGMGRDRTEHEWWMVKA